MDVKGVLTYGEAHDVINVAVDGGDWALPQLANV